LKHRNRYADEGTGARIAAQPVWVGSFNQTPTHQNTANNLQAITLGVCCFWCAVSVYVNVKGVEDVESGYSNGEAVSPRVSRYAQSCRAQRGGQAGVCPIHLQYPQESGHPLRHPRPTTLNRQGHDQGTQHSSGIYYSTPEQKHGADEIIAELTACKHYSSKIVTEVLPIANYSAAEEYQQNFFARNPGQGYCVAVAAPKVAKFRKTFAWLAK
jgi:peptide-methionine (S)-S-oxide reductase